MKNQNLNAEIGRKKVKEQKKKFRHVCLPWMARMPGLTFFLKGEQSFYFLITRHLL
jgi:putative IMPACT (imprinted ancient) family translation regulator